MIHTFFISVGFITDSFEWKLTSWDALCTMNRLNTKRNMTFSSPHLNWFHHQFYVIMTKYVLVILPTNLIYTPLPVFSGELLCWLSKIVVSGLAELTQNTFRGIVHVLLDSDTQCSGRLVVPVWETFLCATFVPRLRSNNPNTFMPKISEGSIFIPRCISREYVWNRAVELEQQLGDDSFLTVLLTLFISNFGLKKVARLCRFGRRQQTSISRWTWVWITFS